MSRMWYMFEIVVLAAIALLFITEFFYPLLTGKPMFGSFRRKGGAASPASFDEEILEARRKAADVRDVQRKAEEDLRAAEQRKSAADELLN